MIWISILWMLYANWEGHREGRYWYYKFRLTGNPNTIVVSDEHTHWSVQRTLVLIGFTIAAGWWFILIAFLTFPFFHDGAYYSERNRLDKTVYRKGWFDQSTSSTAFSTKFFPSMVRTICFFVGLALAIIL